MKAEAAEQAVVVQWLRLMKIWHYHVPNENAHRLMHLGVSAGVPDLIIADHAEKAPYGAAIEMKAPGKKPSDNQWAWMQRLDSLGVAVNWFTDAGLAIRWLQSLGYGRK